MWFRKCQRPSTLVQTMWRCWLTLNIVFWTSYKCLTLAHHLSHKHVHITKHKIIQILQVVQILISFNLYFQVGGYSTLFIIWNIVPNQKYLVINLFIWFDNNSNKMTLKSVGAENMLHLFNEIRLVEWSFAFGN